MKLKFGSLLLAGFAVLATVASATGNFAVRLEAVANQAQQAQQAAGIMVDRILITRGPATGYRQFAERSGPIAPEQGFNIYFEPTGLATRFENGAVRAAMSVDILIRNAAGQTIAARDNAWRLPVTHAAAQNGPLPAVFGDISLNALRLAEGRYQIVLRIHDDFAGTFADRVLDIELRRQAQGPRLSQQQPAAQGQTR